MYAAVVRRKRALHCASCGKAINKAIHKATSYFNELSAAEDVFMADLAF